MLEINSLLHGRYRIEKVIGSGGMGTVYQATDITDNTVWAIKEQKMTAANRRMLLSEAEIMEKMTHPAFPRFRSRWESGGILYIVMEFISGVTLSKLLAERGALPEAEVISIFRQVANALIYLHELETPIVYRDFKTSNLMLEESGKVRIIDLGIAQEYSSESGAEVKAVALTRGYAAPEQYHKRYKLDARADIYALGVTMHYLITGKNPNKPPYVFVPIRKLRRDASQALELIIRKCLQPNPDNRYANARQLAYDLNRIEELDTKLRERFRVRMTVVGVAAALVLCVSLIVYVMNLNSQTASVNTYYAYIESARTAESLETALASLQAAIEHSPENPEAYILVAEKYAEFGQIDQAYEFINETIIPRFPDIYNNQGFINLVMRLELT